MKRLFFFIMAILIVILVITMLLIPEGARYSDYAYLENPRFVVLPSVNVLQVKTKGNPSITIQPAVRLLHKTYRKLTGVSLLPDRHMPIARWYFEPDSPVSEWEGRIIIPVPDSIEEIPPVHDDSDLTVELTKWEYGEVAEILHVGPCHLKYITRNKLKKFIESQGYLITGPLEEQYIKGPGEFWAVDPEDYLTIIRYQVKRK